ncbi:MAG: YeiH family protein [Phycisphaerae bacterium]
MATRSYNISYGGNHPTGRSTYAEALSADAFLSLGSMEGVFDPIVDTSKPSPELTKRRALYAGYAFAGGVAFLAVFAQRLPFPPFTVGEGSDIRHPISSATIAILLGLALRNLLMLPDGIRAGCRHIVKKVIPIAIVLMGARLHWGHMVDIGLTALLITACSIAVAVGASYYVGKMLGLNWKTSLLLGTGTGICGNSAIVAVAPLIDADDDDLVLSIGAVNLFGLLAMLAFPVIGGLLQIGNDQFGVWAGVSIHAVPQVVAAGFAYSADAGTLATAVKLVRVTMLAPLVFILALMYANKNDDTQDGQASERSKLTVRYTRLVPWFVWGFVAFAFLNSLGMLPNLVFPAEGALATVFGQDSNVELASAMSVAGKLLLTLAMAAIGLEVNLRTLGGVGATAVKAGLLATLSLGAASLLMILVLM